MPARSDDPLRRVTLNLYEADCLVFEQFLGQGWTTYIRDTMHKHAQHMKSPITGPEFRRTLGDLE